MVLLTLFASSVLGWSGSDAQIPVVRDRPFVAVGWHDEMDDRFRWSPLNMENRAFTAAPVPGALFLGLERVPAGWPYAFQWSGVSQDLTVDVANFPFLMARVSQVQGYAHLDIDLLGPKGEVQNTTRSTTVQASGMSTVDLTSFVPAGVQRFRLRLIVGGPNSGCCATYRWVRFVSKADAEFLRAHPDWSRVRRPGNMLR